MRKHVILITIFLNVFVILLNNVFADDGIKDFGDKIATEVLIGMDTMFNDFYTETLILLVIDKKGSFILESLGEYLKREQDKKRRIIYNDFFKQAKVLFNQGVYKRVIVRAGENVDYNHLFFRYFSVLFAIQNDYPIYNNVESQLFYSMFPPINKNFDAKKDFLPLNE